MGNLYEELKRRKVFRVAAIYAVVAWLLIQVADTLAPMLNLPEFAPRLVLFLLIILFPLALFLAWAYELGPDGIRADAEAETGVGATASNNLATGAFMLIVALLAGSLYFLNRPGDSATSSSTESAASDITPVDLQKSIAVLPFTAFSSNPDEQFFADGLADTLLHKLAQLSDIRVISRTSSFQYRGEAVDVREVGSELNVATVLEGSVQRSGDQLRIIAQLVNTEDGGHIWSQTFDRGSEDIFAIHDEISDAVVKSLQISLSPEEQQRLQERGTSSTEAYNLLTLIMERTRRGDLFELNTQEFKREQYALIRELDKVLEIDPDYAEVYRAKANLYQILVFQAFSATDDDYHLRKAFEAIRQAMLLDPDNPENYAMYATLLRRSGDFANAEVFVRQALRGLPNGANAVSELRLVLGAMLKNPREQLELVERERELGPGPFLYRREFQTLLSLGLLDEAAQVLRDELATTDSPQQPISDLSYTLSTRAGRHVESMEQLIDVRSRLEDEFTDTFINAWVNSAHVTGQIAERDKFADRISGQTMRATNYSLSLFARERYAEGREFLEQTTQQLPDTLLRDYLARHCLMLEDFECVITNMLMRSPGLDSRENREPTILSASDLDAALPLVVAYRRIGEEDAAARLLRAYKDFVDSRAAEGYAWSTVSASPFYGLPTMYLLLGDEEQGLRLMRERVELSGDNFIPDCGHCSFDSPLFDSVRENPEFQRLIAEYQRRRDVNGERVARLISDAGY